MLKTLFRIMTLLAACLFAAIPARAQVEMHSAERRG